MNKDECKLVGHTVHEYERKQVKLHINLRGHAFCRSNKSHRTYALHQQEE